MLVFQSRCNKLIKSFIVSLCQTEAAPYRFKKSLCKKLLPEFERGIPFKRSFRNYVFEGNTRDHIDKTIFLCGAYEKYMLQAICDLASIIDLKHNIALDIGANVGNHSLYLSTITKEVHAFEPYEMACKQLEVNISNNSINNIHVHRVGLGSENSVVPLYAPEPGNLGSASVNRNFKKETGKVCDIEIRNANEYIKTHDITDIKLIKIDVEGFERSVLNGMGSTLKHNRPVVFFEMSPLTLKTFGKESEFIATFPGSYSFYYFKLANKSNGNYKLGKYCFGDTLRYQDVVAVPDEISPPFSRK